jgi:hypothetical protein
VNTTIHGDLEAAFAAANTDLTATLADPSGDHAAWCRRVASARRVVAEIYALARQSVTPAHGLLWNALHDGEQFHSNRANHLDAIAHRHEQEGGTTR